MEKKCKHEKLAASAIRQRKEVVMKVREPVTRKNGRGFIVTAAAWSQSDNPLGIYIKENLTSPNLM